MKKVLSLILVLVMVAGLIGCDIEPRQQKNNRNSFKSK